jgi:hypothetical protein
LNGIACWLGQKASAPGSGFGDLYLTAGRGLEEAVVQSTQIGAVNIWLRNQPAEVVSAAVASLREALALYANGASVRLPGAMWLISSASA